MATGSSNNGPKNSSAFGNGSSSVLPVQQIGRDEAELYDRQIRLWGMDAQNRLRNASVLIVGMSGLGAEVAKNLMLCGLKALTIMDHEQVSQDDFAAQFLLPLDSINKNRAEASKDRTQVLNPMVELTVVTDELSSKPEEFFKQFDLVILIDQKYNIIDWANKICRKYQIGFQAGGVYGGLGYAFFDFNNQVFLVPKSKANVVDCQLSDDEEEDGPSAKRACFNGNGNNNAAAPVLTLEDEEDQKIKKSIEFPSFEKAFNIDWSNKRFAFRSKLLVPLNYFTIRAILALTNQKPNYDLDELFEGQMREFEKAKRDDYHSYDDLNFALNGPQLSPVCAIVGSFIGQEAIKSISQNDQPLKNILIYSGIDTSAIVCELPPVS